MHIGQAYGFDEPGNPQKARLNVARERFERRPYSVIQDLNLSRSFNIPFLQ